MKSFGSLNSVLLVLIVFLLWNFASYVHANTKYVKILPTDAKVLKPRPRIPIPSSFAKKYWVSGTFFNKRNFQGLPMSFYFTGSKCINFPERKSLASLKPLGCVMLYNSKNCQGPYVVVSHDMDNLEKMGMHKHIGSMRSCPPVDDSWRESTKNLVNLKYQEKPLRDQEEVKDANVDSNSTTLMSTS